MWAWSRKAERGRRRTRPSRLASPGLGLKTLSELGVGAAAGAALQLQGELRLEAQARAVGRLVAGFPGDRGVVGEAEGVGASSPDRRLGGEWIAAGRVEREVGAVDVDLDVPDDQRDAGEDVGDRVRVGAVDA